jgi:hypothetical protein
MRVEIERALEAEMGGGGDHLFELKVFSLSLVEFAAENPISVGDKREIVRRDSPAELS